MSVSREELRSEAIIELQRVHGHWVLRDERDFAAVVDTFLAVPGVAAALRLTDEIRGAAIVSAPGASMVHFPGDAEWVYWSSISGVIDRLRSVLSEPNPEPLEQPT